MRVGSGLAGFDVQVRQGAAGAWQPWLTGTVNASGVYNGQRSQRYSFRVRAIDTAGNVSPWATAGGRNTVLVDAIDNGAFSTQNFTGWDTTVTLGLALIQEQDLYPGEIVPAARLGSPTWQACGDPGNIPTLECGDSWSGISQRIVVPSLAGCAAAHAGILVPAANLRPDHHNIDHLGHSLPRRSTAALPLGRLVRRDCAS